MGKIRTRGANKTATRIVENNLVKYWSKHSTKGIMVRGIDSRLLNVSVMDGGLGITVKGRPPIRSIVTMTVPPTNDFLQR